MKSKQASPAGASTEREGWPSARIATVTCYNYPYEHSIKEEYRSTYNDEGDGVDKALNKEGVA